MQTEANSKKYFTLSAMALALSMVFIDQSALPIALPSIQANLGITSSGLQWIVNAYLLVLAALIIFGGKIGDIFGHRKAFLIGIVIFMLSSIACGLSSSGLVLILCRAIQGIGGAFMIPSSGVIIINAFPPQERGKAMGIYVAAASVFLSLGPIFGGVITQYLGWQWIFFVNPLLAGVSITLTLFSVSTDSPNKKASRELDWSGFTALSIGLLTLVFALMEGVNYGWNSPLILSSLLIGILSLYLFIRIESKKTNPLVDLSFFSNRTSLCCIILLMLAQAAIISTVFLAIFMENILHYSAFTSGLMMLPFLLPVTFASPIAGKLFDRFGPRVPAALGAAILALSAVWIAITAQSQEYFLLLPGLIGFGLSIPLLLSSAITSIIVFSEPQKRGVASGIANAARQMGGALGLAIIGAVISNLAQFRLSELLPNTLSNLSGKQVDQLINPGIAQNLLARFSPDDISLIHSAATKSYVFAFSSGMFLIAMVGMLSFALARKLPGASIEEPNETSEKSRPIKAND